MSDIINAVKRLERAGSESSRATEKLFEAATRVAHLVKHTTPPNIMLPRDYKVIDMTANGYYRAFLVKVDTQAANYDPKAEDCFYEYIDGLGNIPATNRQTILDFAADIATGWLDELADFLEARNTKDVALTSVLTDAVEKAGDSK